MGNWLLWLLIGVVFILGGIFSLLNPLTATLTAEQITGWLFVIGGVAQVVAAFRTGVWGARFLNIVLALAYVWFGVSLLANPFAGVLALTMLAAIMFLVNGILKVFLALSLRGSGAFWPILISGAVSVVLAAMVFTNFPQSAAVLLGVLLAIELLSSGAMMVVYALSFRNASAA